MSDNSKPNLRVQVLDAMFCNLVTRLSNAQRGRQELRSERPVHKKTNSGTRYKVIRHMLLFSYPVCCVSSMANCFESYLKSFLSIVSCALEFCDSTVEHLYGRQEQKLHNVVYKKNKLGDLLPSNPACSLAH